MNNKNLLRGLFLTAFATVFGVWSTRYTIGELSRAGPGLFPLLVSSLLFVIGVITIIRSRFVPKVPLDIRFRNIGFVLGGLCGFALLSEYVNMIVGIIFMVFCATVAGTSYSVARNVKICAGLIAIAFALQRLLGLNLPLY
ncbi:MAG: tripartite tricarboxylate transporter TctB family protein [Burkholderiales bacterium]